MKENQTDCDSSVFRKGTGMKLTQKGGKNTPSGKKTAAVPGAEKN
jgi:hypothetical protein